MPQTTFGLLYFLVRLPAAMEIWSVEGPLNDVILESLWSYCLNAHSWWNVSLSKSNLQECFVTSLVNEVLRMVSPPAICKHLSMCVIIKFSWMSMWESRSANDAVRLLVCLHMLAKSFDKKFWGGRTGKSYGLMICFHFGYMFAADAVHSLINTQLRSSISILITLHPTRLV